jgi:hypothetical protein
MHRVNSRCRALYFVYRTMWADGRTIRATPERPLSCPRTTLSERRVRNLLKAQHVVNKTTRSPDKVVYRQGQQNIGELLRTLDYRR